MQIEQLHAAVEAMSPALPSVAEDDSYAAAFYGISLQDPPPPPRAEAKADGLAGPGTRAATGTCP